MIKPIKLKIKCLSAMFEAIWRKIGFFNLFNNFAGTIQ